MTEAEAEELANIIRSAVARMGEHFDTVVVVATTCQERNRTHLFSASCGNRFAQVGSVEEWLSRIEDPEPGQGDGAATPDD